MNSSPHLPKARLDKKGKRVLCHDRDCNGQIGYIVRYKWGNGRRTFLELIEGYEESDGVWVLTRYAQQRASVNPKRAKNRQPAFWHSEKRRFVDLRERPSFPVTAKCPTCPIEQDLDPVCLGITDDYVWRPVTRVSASGPEGGVARLAARPDLPKNVMIR